MKRFLPILLLLSTSAMAVDFNRDIRPILSDKCFACHGFDEAERKADLRLDTKEGAFTDLGGYFAFVAGKPEKSETWLRIDLPEDDEDVMPPEDFHKPLTAEEKSLIKQWIADGAEYDLHWSYKPLEKPEGKGIDDFINQQLTEKGLAMSQEADRATLARRLHLDLLGLPPTVETVDAFVKDNSPEAYGKLVDQLLENSAYGERMAVYWLDLVRYADTIGYHSDVAVEVSAYRDYVIKAFNENMRYDQFTIEQLAGDLLPNATLEQKIASGYNRLLQTTAEGGSQAAEYMAIYAADRVRNVSGVWLGSTIGCAQCHDHKYDPFSARDFYSMAAFFADVKEVAIGKRKPNLNLPTPDEEKRMAELKKKLADNTITKVVASDAVLSKKIAVAQQAWETKSLKQIERDKLNWTPVKPVALRSESKQKLTRLPDFSVLASGANPDKDTYRVTLRGSGKVTGFRLEALTDDSLSKNSSSRGNGNFILSGVTAEQNSEAVKIASVEADFSQKNWPVANTLDGNNKTGWAVDGHKKSADHVAVFLFEKPIDLGKKGKFTVKLQHQSTNKHIIGRFRISTTNKEKPPVSRGIAFPQKVIDILKITAKDRDKKQKTELSNFHKTKTPLLDSTRKNLADWKRDLDKITSGMQTMLVSESLEEPRMTRILARGNWQDEDGEIVQATLPAFLPKDKDNVIAEGQQATRLDLAKWIMADSNPLTARTFTNRMWKQLFGSGISSDLFDLGGQGKPPTHPELLDWLSVEFRESGWDVKNLVKTIVMSDAYRQVSTVSPELKKADPSNLLYGRQGRWRIEAEFVRDTALQLAGLLVDEKLGGRSVKPYQPAGYWENLNFPPRKWQAGEGDELYRRGIYTFWCRTFPHPAMVAFDAPSREECTAERSRSNIPQQALVLLNDPVFVEAAKKFGERIAKLKGDDRISQAWKFATSREPTAEEKTILEQLYQKQKVRYKKDEAAAKEFLSIGETPTSNDASPAESAAWATVARAILNAYETTSRF